MLRQAHNAILIDQRAGLQELAQLVHLNQLRPFHRASGWPAQPFFAGSFDAGFQIGAGFHVNRKFTRQFEVDGIQPPGGTSIGVARSCMRCGRSHGFTIQLGTSPTKARGHDRLAGVILHCDHRGFDIQRTVGVSQTKNDRQTPVASAGKQHFAGRAEFDDRTLGEITAAMRRPPSPCARAAPEAHRASHPEKSGPVPPRGWRSVLCVPLLCLAAQAINPLAPDSIWPECKCGWAPPLPG